MSVPVEVLRHHLSYTQWANQRLLESAAALSSEEQIRDFQTADKSVLGTLNHVYAAERVWLERVQEVPNPAAWRTKEPLDLAALNQEWAQVVEGWNRWAQGLTDADAARAIAYSDLRGNPWRNQLWHIVLHVVNHSTHHRGQVSGFLRAMGKIPPSLDFIAFVRTRSQ